MPIDLAAAERFVHANARLLDRHRFAVLRHGASADPIVDALRPYRNADGGFGHALEPDVRAPESEPTAVLHALDVLDEAGRLDDPMVDEAGAWVARIAEPDGGVPFVMPTAADHPHAPWMVPSDGGSHLTFALTAVLGRAGTTEPWLERATAWCWAQLAEPQAMGAYSVKFALRFLDEVGDGERAAAAIEGLRPLLDVDGCVPVGGGTEHERLTPLDLAARPGGRSATLFTGAQVEADLATLEAGQQDDGGWTFSWLAWAPGQSVEWRGAVTVEAVATLSAYGRIAPTAR